MSLSRIPTSQPVLRFRSPPETFPSPVPGWIRIYSFFLAFHVSPETPEPLLHLRAPLGRAPVLTEGSEGAAGPAGHGAHPEPSGARTDRAVLVENV